MAPRGQQGVTPGLCSVSRIYGEKQTRITTEIDSLGRF